MSVTSRLPHQRCGSSGLRNGLVLELARRHRSVPLELAQHVALEARVRDEELGAPALVRVAPTAPAAPHSRLDERQRLDRPDVRVPLEELLLDPQQPVELRDVVRAEPAPEDELLRRCDGRDRVDLQEAELPHGVEDASSPSRRGAARGPRCAALPPSTRSSRRRRLALEAPADIGRGVGLGRRVAARRPRVEPVRVACRRAAQPSRRARAPRARQ